MEPLNPDKIPKGSLCVMDTNVLLCAEQGLSSQVQRLIRGCSEGQLVGILPQTVWQELTHKLMLAEALMMGAISGPNPVMRLAKHPNIVKSLYLYKEKINALANLGIGFEHCTRSDFFEAAPLLREKYGLLTNDSVILATAVRLGADFLVTADNAFLSVSELQVAMPSDTGP